MSNITSGAAARRESARGHGTKPGEFGYQAHSAPDESAFAPVVDEGDTTVPSSGDVGVPVDFEKIRLAMSDKAEDAAAEIQRLRRALEIQEGLRAEATQRHWRAGVSSTIDALAEACPDVRTWLISVDNSGGTDGGGSGYIEGFTRHDGTAFTYRSTEVEELRDRISDLDLEFFDNLSSSSGLEDDDGDERMAGLVEVSFDRGPRIVTIADTDQYGYSRSDNKPGWNTIAAWSVDDPDQGMSD